METIILILLAGIIAALAWQIHRVQSGRCKSKRELPLFLQSTLPNTAKWYGMYIMRCGIWRRNRRKRRMRVKCRE